MNRIYRSLILAILLVVSTTAPVVGADPGAKFSQDVTTVTAGETAEIPVSLSNTDSAVVTIGSEEVNYIATVVIQDGNNDQNVTLEYNTSKAGHGGAFSVASDADNFTVKNETEFENDHQLDSGAYPLSITPGTNNSEDNETDGATLTVMESSEDTTERETETATPSPYAGHVDDIENGVIVAPAQNQTITGTLNLSEGTEVVVSAKKGGVFFKTQSTTVTKNGRFRVSFDFDSILKGDLDNPEFQIEIRADGETQKEVTGTFQTPPTTQQDTQDTTTKQAIKDETTRETTSSQNGSVPGFGIVTVVVALSGTLLLGLLRD